MKKIISSILTCALLFSSVFAISCAAEVTTGDQTGASTVTEVKTTTATATGATTGTDAKGPEAPGATTGTEVNFFDSIKSSVFANMEKLNGKIVDHKTAILVAVGGVVLSAIGYVIYREYPVIVNFLNKVKENVVKATVGLKNRIVSEGKDEKALTVQSEAAK
ncbi:MAG: hypothetical protein RUMPE_00356 [Eubacteriales bacterium SKADARSKE-1]|nr:hypothetical protein [Eubacteriales bacterium SKADARSKE-1]